ncbi:isocitrate lyase/phosphoenolpyruvate mutase family protein [Catellatospora sp. KI3]|uniref:isocitrate lyase/PEP mutase family protein n=1 Tax=Catellatospora sp. KI3 TaxID=3041620 RepID=UPI00248220E1|nr:isocitrate lyase/phosphoenolpyruvate mutase family protein [Catellatospora sp. KI3]MDI1462921.1 isocitrate lyase/phosphoenolpyruvate mutase family protein [Catellatospora sp. KI3]
MTSGRLKVMNSAAAFRSLHVPGTPLVLANAWDAVGARIAAASGAPAVATTSAGVCWAVGAPDGGVLARDEALGQLARIVRAVAVPVTADIESGFGDTPAEVADTIRAVLAIGAVGVNIEDRVRGGAHPLREVDDQCERLAAAKQAGGDGLFVNVRVDTFLAGAGGLAETVERAKAYVAAGADGVFVPGTADPHTIGALVAAIPAPVNILAGPGSPTVAQLAGLGVARISLGSSVAEAAYAVVMRAAREALETGTYTALADKADYGTLNDLMR